MNLTHELLIIGDLNMDWLCEKGDKLRKFWVINSQVNYVKQPISQIRYYFEMGKLLYSGQHDSRAGH